MLKNNYIILVLSSLFLWSCSAKHIEVSHKPVLTLLSPQATNQNDTMNSYLCHMEIGFHDTRKDLLEFELCVSNNSTDTLQLDPSSFYYVPIFHDIDTTSDRTQRLVKCIDPEKIITQLSKQKDSLFKMVNPYSLTHKKTGEIIQYALIRGTIAFLFGQKPEEMEETRRNDEDNWDSDHSYYITDVNNQLDFWQYKALRPMKLLPNTQIKGMVLFPIEKEANEIVIKLPNKWNTQTVRYQQEIL